MYTCIGGGHPQPANDREKADALVPLRSLAKQNYSDELFDIVEWCLQLDHMMRPQTAFELQKILGQEPPEAVVLALIGGIAGSLVALLLGMGAAKAGGFA